MSFRECIVNGEAEGSLTPEQSENARQLFDELEQEYTGRMSAAAAKQRRQERHLTHCNFKLLNANAEKYSRSGRGNVFL